MPKSPISILVLTILILVYILLSIPDSLFSPSVIFILRITSRIGDPIGPVRIAAILQPLAECANLTLRPATDDVRDLAYELVVIRKDEYLLAAAVDPPLVLVAPLGVDELTLDGLFVDVLIGDHELDHQATIEAS